MKFELYSDAVLARDVPQDGFRRGDVVKVIDHHPIAAGEDGYSLEVFNVGGDTIAVSTVPESALAPLRDDGIWCVRQPEPGASG